MILVWGMWADPPVSAVLAALARIGAKTYFLDQSDPLDAEFVPNPHADIPRDLVGTVRTPAGVLDLAAVTAAYIRPIDTTRLLADRGVCDEDRRRLATLEDALLCWSEIAPSLIVNRPDAMASNNSKPYQAALIHAQGFAVPETLVTTDVDALRGFQARHGALIYKSSSGVRSIVARYDEWDDSRHGNLTTCPTMFQRWIRGTDVRVHVVGGDVFACAVISPAIDYRYPASEAERPILSACRLPRVIAQRCRQLAAALRLDLAGIDLRRTESGEWVCFEVNPSPGFTYYEDAANLPIAAAVAALLARAGTSDLPRHDCGKVQRRSGRYPPRRLCEG